MKNMELKKRFKHKYIIRIAAGAVTVAVLGTSIGVSAYSVHAEKNNVVQNSQESKKNDTEKKEEEETLKKALSVDEEDTEAGKEETVYIVASPNGTTKSVIVSEWLKNKEGSAILEDVSDLKDIKNVKGDETFTQNGDKITWQANGNDIYYQGTMNKELPVTEKVTYYLDGKEMTPEEIAGKSGTVTIRFDYKNHEKSTQVIDGKTYEVYVPFTVMTGIILPENYKNVKVINGKVISDGNKKLAVGVAMPGLKESLEIKEGDLKEDIEIPEYVEVTADVENFSLEMTMTVIMNDLISDANLVDSLDFSSLEKDMDTLEDASGQLVDGSEELSKGLGTLKGSLQEFSSGVDTLKEGITNYTNGAAQLKEGIGVLAGSSNTFVDGVTTLNGSAATLNQGVAELDRTLKTEMTEEEKSALISQADTAIENTFSDPDTGTEAIKNQASAVFYDNLANNQEAKEQVTAGFETYTTTMLNSVLNSAYSQVATETAKKDKIAEAKPQVVQAVTQQVVQTVTQQVTAGVATQVIGAQAATVAEQTGGILDVNAIAQICEAVNTAINTEGSEAQQQISALIAEQDIDGLVATNVDAQMATIEAQIDEALSSADGQAQIQATVDELVNQTVAAAMADETLKVGMTDAASQIVTGIADGAKDTVGTAVADTAKTAAKTAAEAATLTAVSGTKAQISAAINTVDEASGYSLVTGMQALSDGTRTMNDNMPALTAGISQLTNGAATLVSNNGALVEGAGKLSSATLQLGDGVNKLADGSDELKNGMIQFDKDGIQKLLDAYNGDIKGLMDKLEAVVNAGEEYQSFTKIADKTKGSVKFILRTEAIKAEE